MVEVVAAVEAAAGVEAEAAAGVETEEGEVVGVAAGHHQICHTMIWDHFHRGTGIPRLPG